MRIDGTSKQGAAYALLVALLCATSACKNQPKTEPESQAKSICPPADISSAPAQVGPVTDGADVFMPESEKRLEASILKFEKDHPEQLVVVTVKSLAGQEITGFACNLGRKWGIGDKNRHDGIVILVAPSEGKLRIAVGYGLEKRLPDTALKSVIDNNVVSEFKQQRFETGVSNAIREISKRLSGS